MYVWVSGIVAPADKPPLLCVAFNAARANICQLQFASCLKVCHMQLDCYVH